MSLATEFIKAASNCNEKKIVEFYNTPQNPLVLGTNFLLWLGDYIQAYREGDNNKMDRFYNKATDFKYCNFSTLLHGGCSLFSKFTDAELHAALNAAFDQYDRSHSNQKCSDTILQISMAGTFDEASTLRLNEYYEHEVATLSDLGIPTFSVSEDGTIKEM